MIPKPVLERETELIELVNRNPLYIPVPQAATYLRMNVEGLRSCIEIGQCPFGIAWKKDARGNKAFKIPTLTFFNWCSGRTGFSGQFL